MSGESFPLAYEDSGHQTWPRTAIVSHATLLRQSSGRESNIALVYVEWSLFFCSASSHTKHIISTPGDSIAGHMNLWKVCLEIGSLTSLLLLHIFVVCSNDLFVPTTRQINL